MKRAFGFIIGTVIGGLVGATLALLFAPTSGVEARARIQEWAESFSTDIRQAADSRRIELQNRLQTLRTPKP